MFKLYGHASVSLMNAGRLKSEKDGRALTTDPPSITPTTYSASPADTNIRAFQRDVQDALGDTGTVMIDVRSPAEFNGEVMAPPELPETAQRMGRIPGAQSVPWLMAVNEDDGTRSSQPMSCRRSTAARARAPKRT